MTDVSPVPATPLTFMQAWGQLVWMTIVISTLSASIWHSVGPLSAVVVTVMLACLELVMFEEHVLRKHAYQKHAEHNHPLAKWLHHKAKSDLIVLVVGLAWLCTWVGLISIWMTLGAERRAAGIVLLVIGQACLSESIHRVAHKDTVFHHRRLTTWIEPALYAGAIIGVVGGVWLIR